MKKQNPTIKLTKKTMELLLEERLTPRESYEEIIKRLLNSYNKIEWVQGE